MKKYFLFCLIAWGTSRGALEKLAILIVIDSLSYQSLKKVEPFLSGGLASMLNNGIKFENAHYQYARTATGPGHTTISTGCWPSMHGIIGNNWLSPEGQKIYCVAGQPEKDAVFAPCGVYEKERSAKNICVDGIADQVILASTVADPISIAIGLKSRTAICLATRLGKAFWLDAQCGQFTSSKAYFEELPDWIKKFNQEHDLLASKKIEWSPFFDQNHKAYHFAQKHDGQKPFMSQTLLLTAKNRDEFFSSYKEYPISNKLLLDCALSALKEYSADKKNIYLSIGLGSLDRINHRFGPDSKKYIDTIYHIDAYLQDFLNTISLTYSTAEIMICLTADHGNISLPEFQQAQGFSLAKRIDSPTLQRDLNRMIHEKYDLADLVLRIDNPSVFLDQTLLQSVDKKTQKKIMHDIKQKLKHIDGIKDAWSAHELMKLPSGPTDFVTYFKNQHFPGRSGDIYYQLLPYCTLTKLTTGIHHAAYNYTTHVPLIICGKNKLGKRIKESVWMTQLAPTLAEFFGIPKPSACLQNSLPGINLHNK